MITPSEYYEDEKYMGSEMYFGLSTETKPTSCGNGSFFIEIDNFGKTDTPYIFCYDAENSKWYPELESGD